MWADESIMHWNFEIGFACNLASNFWAGTNCITTFLLLLLLPNQPPLLWQNLQKQAYPFGQIFLGTDRNISKQCSPNILDTNLPSIFKSDGGNS